MHEDRTRRRWLKDLIRHADETLAREGDGGWRVVGAFIELEHRDGRYLLIANKEIPIKRKPTQN